MNRRLKFLTILASGSIAACLVGRLFATSELNLDDVIAKHVDALGGMDKLHGIKSMRATGTISVGPVNAGRVAQEWKHTDVDQMRMDMQTGPVKSVRVYDGKDGWEMMPQLGQQAPTRMTPDELRDMRAEADVLGPLVTYKERGLTVELTGRVMVEDADCYRIQISLKDGAKDDTLVEFIDAQTFLEPRTELTRKTDAGDFVTTVKYSDYRTVDGLMIPFATDAEVIIPNQQPQQTQFQADKVEVNPKLDDRDFATPPELATTQPAK